LGICANEKVLTFCGLSPCGLGGGRTERSIERQREGKRERGDRRERERVREGGRRREKGR
jgi:hypothetical protein